MVKWTSERGQLVNIGLLDGCRRIQLPLGTSCRYDFDGFGGYLGNFGLDVSKIVEHKLVLMEEELDVAEMVESCCCLTKPRAKNRNINLENRVPNGLPTLFADERAIKQILLNLLSNVVKSTSKNGKVTIGARVAANGEFVITVTDTGIGMNEKSIATAMVPFGQADSNIARKCEGTGLGLPLTKGLVIAHTGRLEIESEVDSGTTVTVTFPPERMFGNKPVFAPQTRRAKSGCK